MFAIWRSVKELFGRVKLDRQLDDEVDFHLAMLEEQFRARGMTTAEAAAAARREFGGVAHIKESYRGERGLPWLETTGRDLRYALRGLGRSPGFAAAAVLSLALGIGANTAVFSLFHALLLRLLPVARPTELVDLYQTGGWIDGHSSYPLYQQIAGRTDLFEGVIARTDVSKVLFAERPGARMNYTQREFVSGNYFEVLGVNPAIGRLFQPSDDRVPGGHPLAVLSYDCWRNRYGANPAVVGSTILVDEKPLTVIGVAAPGFRGLQVERRTEIWEPIMMAEASFKNAHAWWLQIVARARPEIPRKQLQAAVNVLMAQHVASTTPTSWDAAFRRRMMAQRLQVRDAGIGLSMLREMFAKPLRILMAAVGLVLLMACTNVANLALARGAARRKEVAMRFSLGATRARLVRQALTECILLAAAGALVGTGLGFWGTRLILGFLPAEAGNPLSPSPEPTVLVFTLAISVLSAVVFGLVPALRSTAVAPASGLRSETGGGAAKPLLRRVLVVAQVAFSVVLVVMAALFGRSLFELRSVDLGFRNQEVYEIGLDFRREWRNKDLRVPCAQFASRLQALPGMISVTYGLPAPFVRGSATTSIKVPGSARTADGPVDVETAYLAPRYFETLGTPLIAGREFDRGDTAETRKVAMVNEAFVRMFLPGEAHPDHRLLDLGGGKPEAGEATWIVGVVRNTRTADIQQTAKPTVYLPIAQHEIAYPPVLLVRTQLPTMTLLRAAYGELHKVGPLTGFSIFDTIRRHIDDSIFEQRLLAGLSGFFGVLALVLAAIGLYGVVSYGTAGRTGEIGVRIALGARRGQVLGMILRDSLALVSVGLILGLFASFAAARAVASMLYGIKPSDPPAFVFTAVALAITGVAAALLPARRAASLDPMRALRHP